MNHVTHRIRSAFAALALLTLATPAHAYFSTIDNGEVIEAGKFQASVEPQLIFNRYDGVNLVGRFDTGINESSSVRGVLGFGKVDFQIGGFYKWVPFPDTANQPAIGLDAGALLATVKNRTEFSIRLHPLISKLLQSEVGDFVPYGSIPFGITTRSDKTVVPIQFVAGSEFRPLNWPRISFFGELGIGGNESFSYLSLALAYRFDEETLRKRR